VLGSEEGWCEEGGKYETDEGLGGGLGPEWAAALEG
jgi:hypothetical protein